MKAGRIVLIVFGVIIALFGLALAGGGGTMLWADATQRDDDGFFTTRSIDLTSPGHAVVSDRVDLGTDSGPWAVDLGDLAEVRLRVTAGDPARELFVGIGPQEDVQAYLAGVRYTQVRDVDVDPLRIRTLERPGTGTPQAPADQGFWVEQASGPGTQTVTWRLETGRWMVVVMNADATAGVRADTDLGVKIKILRGLGIGFLVGGLVLLGIGVTMLVFGLRGGGGAPGPPAGTDAAGADDARTAAATTAAPPRAHPLRLEGVLDDDRHLSRWVWIFKWLLAIPHYIIVSILTGSAWMYVWNDDYGWTGWGWGGMIGLLVFFAAVVLLFTGRYPRGIFDFVMGLNRWVFRVWAYAALMRDEYPPMRLDPGPREPATDQRAG